MFSTYPVTSLIDSNYTVNTLNDSNYTAKLYVATYYYVIVLFLPESTSCAILLSINNK